MPLARAAAAVLACGPDAALSHASALALWRFIRRWPEQMELTTSRFVKPVGLLVHRSPSLLPGDLTTQLGIRVTRPARTILDVAPGYPPHRLPRLVNDALHTPFLTRGQLLDACERHPHHGGTQLILPFADAGGGPTRSDWEDDFPGWCAARGLPVPLVDHPIGRREVDAFFPGERLIVELDSWEFHRDRQAFEDDRDRDADHLALGLATIRITWDRRYGAPDTEAERLRQILALRRQAA